MIERLSQSSVQPGAGMSRRRFLYTSGALAAAALLPMDALATPTAKDLRVLSFLHTHTGERLETAYCCGGKYNPEALRAINHLLRDFRANEIKPIDVRLLDLLSDLRAALGTDQPYHVISGYRSPRTNGMLRASGGEGSGVASGSLHMVGKAIDIRVPGVKLETLRSAALALESGGVGYYRASNFVHVDTGRVRFW